MDSIKTVGQDIDRVFAKFDVDGNGYLERDELKVVGAELGLDMTNADVDNMIKDLDYNLDGKISREEFNLWWLAGR